MRGCLTSRQQKNFLWEARLWPELDVGERPGSINSRLENLRNLAPAERLRRVADATSLGDAERAAFGAGTLPIALANGMIENVIGTFELPVGVASNFTDQRPRLPDADGGRRAFGCRRGVLYGAHLRKSGGFRTSSTAPIMRAQVQVLGVRRPVRRARRSSRARGDHRCGQQQGQGVDLARRRLPRHRGPRIRADPRGADGGRCI